MFPFVLFAHPKSVESGKKKVLWADGEEKRKFGRKEKAETILTGF